MVQTRHRRALWASFSPRRVDVGWRGAAKGTSSCTYPRFETEAGAEQASMRVQSVGTTRAGDNRAKVHSAENSKGQVTRRTLDRRTRGRQSPVRTAPGRFFCHWKLLRATPPDALSTPDTGTLRATPNCPRTFRRSEDHVDKQESQKSQVQTDSAGWGPLARRLGAAPFIRDTGPAGHPTGFWPRTRAFICYLRPERPRRPRSYTCSAVSQNRLARSSRLRKTSCYGRPISISPISSRRSGRGGGDGPPAGFASTATIRMAGRFARQRPKERPDLLSLVEDASRIPTAPSSSRPFSSGGGADHARGFAARCRGSILVRRGPRSVPAARNMPGAQGNPRRRHAFWKSNGRGSREQRDRAVVSAPRGGKEGSRRRVMPPASRLPAIERPEGGWRGFPGTPHFVQITAP